MKFTFAALLALSASAQAKNWYDEVCDSQKTVTKTVYANGPEQTVPPPVGINPPKYSQSGTPEELPGSNQPWTPNEGTKHWKHHKGGKHYPKKEWPKPEPKPDIPPITVCTYTVYDGPGKPPVTTTETVTNEKIVRPVKVTITTTITKTVGGNPTYETTKMTKDEPGKTETCFYPPRKTHTVKVGGKGADPLVYTPPVIWPKKDDIVIFDFLFKNHTVTESAFEDPCKSSGGFDSGFQPNESNEEGAETWEFLVKDELPHYAYCRQDGHCEKGMVFAMNPTPERPFDKFREAAMATADNPQPEDPEEDDPRKDGPRKDDPPKGNPPVGDDKDEYDAPMEIPVIVGGKLDGSKDLVFTGPDGKPFVNAKSGDKVLFKFLGPSHTVTQSSFENPCEGIKLFATGKVNNTNDDRENAAFIKEFLVPDGNEPLWFYCGIKTPKNHCKEGMVFAINPPETGNTFEMFFEKAKNSTPAPEDKPAQGDKPEPSPPTVDPPQPAKTHIVKVGGKRHTSAPVLKFTGPDGNPFIDAKPFDVVEFYMGGANHTVTQSSFEKPCEKNTEDGGFATGVVENQDDKEGPEFIRRFPVPVGDKPIWFYCGTPGHCQKGMVFAINAPKEGDKTFEKFLEIAKNSPPKDAPHPTEELPVGTNPLGDDPKDEPNVTHVVKVGGNEGLMFNPPFVNAKKNDIIAFEMGGKTHTVTESTFDIPCEKKPKPEDQSAPMVFSTGPIENPNNEGGSAFIKSYIVPDDSARWFYCGFGNHCTQGMVFAINPSVEQSFEAFREKAKASPQKQGTNPPDTPTSGDGPKPLPSPSDAPKYGS